MLKLLTVALESDKLTPFFFTPTTTTVGMQLSYQPKGVVIELIQVENGYSIKLLDIPAGQQQPKPVLKASSVFTDSESEGYKLCNELFEKHFGADEQTKTCDHVAGLLEDKKLKIGAKNS